MENKIAIYENAIEQIKEQEKSIPITSNTLFRDCIKVIMQMVDSQLNYIDPTPTMVDCGFTREELEFLITDIIDMMQKGIAQNKMIRQSIINKANHLLTAPQHFPQIMEVWDNDEKDAKPYDVFGMFKGQYMVKQHGSYVFFKHARPIQPKEKELKDLVKGDKVWNKQKLNCYIVDEIYGDVIYYDKRGADRKYIKFADFYEYLSLTPPTKSQIAAAKAAAIAEVEQRFKEIEEVANG